MRLDKHARDVEAPEQLFPEETKLLLEQNGFEVLERSREIGDSIAYVCRAR